MAAPTPFVIIAHRGDSSAAPENTLESFDLAVNRGFFNFETDCQLSADGVPVILHDETLGLVNTGSGPAAAATVGQLQQLDAGSWFAPQFSKCRIPTLEQVLVKYRGRVHMHLELKSQQQALPAAVAALVRQLDWLPAQLRTCATAADVQQQQQQQQGHAADTPPATSQPQATGAAEASLPGQSIGHVPGLTITSFHLEQLQASKQLLPEVPHGWLIQEVTPGIISTAVQSGLGMVCPRANALTADGVAQLNQAGLAVRAWGVKSIELLHHVVECGVDGATVNWPQQAADALCSTAAVVQTLNPAERG